MAIMTNFSDYSAYYDLLYKDKCYLSEADYVVGQLDNQGVHRGRLLELGSGTGKHGVLFAQSGFTVDGVELSEEMVSRSATHESFRNMQGDIRDFDFPYKYDAAVALFHVMSYQLTNRDVGAVMSSVGKHLKLGGVFLFDFWYSPSVFTIGASTKIKRYADDNIEIVRIAEPDLYPHESRVDVNYTINIIDQDSAKLKVINERHSMRHFTLNEIDLFAEIHGFERVCTEQFETGQPITDESWAVAVILKKVRDL